MAPIDLALCACGRVERVKCDGADWTLVTRSQSHLSLGRVELPLVEFSISEGDDDAGRACRTQTLRVLSHNRPNLGGGHVISLTVSLLMYLHISLQLKTKRLTSQQRTSDGPGSNS